MRYSSERGVQIEALILPDLCTTCLLASLVAGGAYGARFLVERGVCFVCRKRSSDAAGRMEGLSQYDTYTYIWLALEALGDGAWGVGGWSARFVAMLTLGRVESRARTLCRHTLGGANQRVLLLNLLFV